ncbi:MAG: biotin/lipoyl-containing protein [Candidatus Thorarchaeota archaeon]
MSSEYDIQFDGQDFKVEIKRLDEGGLLVIKVGEESFTIKTTQNEDGSFCVNDTITDHNVRVVTKSGRKVSLEFNGEARELEWERVRKAQSTTSSAAPTAGGGPKIKGGVYPPMPGKITEVSVKVGDSVKSGQTVCILEAMKMFNELKAPSDGTVKEVNVELGSAVTTNDLLILIE